MDAISEELIILSIILRDSAVTCVDIVVSLLSFLSFSTSFVFGRMFLQISANNLSVDTRLTHLCRIFGFCLNLEMSSKKRITAQRINAPFVTGNPESSKSQNNLYSEIIVSNIRPEL